MALITPSTTIPTTIDVALGDRSYPIVLTPDLPGPLAADLLRARIPATTRALVVTDANVGALYGAGVVDALAARGLAVALLTLPPGEGTKTLDVIGRVIDAALDHGVLRGDALVALGGGVIGDVTGFAAAVLHRGVGFLQLPTSLLAQVDSAVGGKTGVNRRHGKNLVGAFWQPAAVVSSAAVLATLPPREVRCGLAEALKHAFIADAALLDAALAEADALRGLAPGPTARLVAACCRIKAAVVGADERDEGDRALLNLGHTFGHAYELLAGFGALTHGEAVALGMVLAARLSERTGAAPAGVEARVVEALRAFGLPADPDAPDLPRLPELIAAARTDKKADDGGVRFVLFTAVGHAVSRRLSWDAIAAALGADR